MSSVEIGDVLEAAIWLTGHEPEEAIDDIKAYLTRSLEDGAIEMGLIVSEPEFEFKYPNEDRVPEVPDHVSGPEVRLLVCTSEALRYRSTTTRKSWIIDLDPQDLDRLRIITRRAWQKNDPKISLTDDQCDQLIEQIGPSTSQKALVAAVESKMIH